MYQQMPKRVRDPNEIIKKKILQNLLRKVVRRIIINKQWQEKEVVDDDRKISSNVKENILFVVRARRKLGLLTLKEKTLLRIPQMFRTIDERKKLCSLVIELECFRLLPPILRAQLVPVLKLMTLEPGRQVLNQGDKPMSIFFIVTGEVEMYKLTGNTKKNLAVISLGPGACIGDIAMLEDGLRSHSYITKSHCELLVVFENDFINILKPYMTKHWTDKKKAIRAFYYFDFLNEEQRLITCKLSSLKQYQPFDTICQQEKGFLTNVHFVLSGECAILQCLNMKVIVKNGKKQYELIDTVDAQSTDRNIFQTLSISSDDNLKTQENLFSKRSHKDVKTICQNLHSERISNKMNLQSLLELTKYISSLDVKINLSLEEAEGVSSNCSSGSKSRIVSTYTFTNNNSKAGIQNNQRETESEIFTASSTSSSTNSHFKPLNSLSSPLTKFKYESHFINVGSVTFGGIFGLGEQTENRIIMARTTVQCLLVPRFFLLAEEQNPENIWQRRILYLESMIPSRENLFENFVQNIKWKKFKKDFLQQVIEFNTLTTARGDDIPILCRIEAEEND